MSWFNAEVLIVLLSAAGGAAMALHAWYQRGRGKLRHGRVVIATLIGTLAGWTFARLGSAVGLDEDWRYVMAACGGAGGMELMRRLLEYLFGKVTGGGK